MKRNPNIILLSRDHHFSLLFCWKIRQGISKNVDPKRIRPYVQYFWKEHLAEHFREEETVLMYGLNDPLCMRALEEHGRIASLVADIGESGGAIADDYRDLANLVDDHIRFEERELFPFLEETLSTERLAAIGAELSRLHDGQQADAYEDVFWK